MAAVSRGGTVAMHRGLIRSNTLLLAASGVEAIELYRAGTRPDVVVLDLDMPEMSGMECFEQIRLIDPDVPGVFVSGMCPETRRQELLRRGATACLQKPLHATELDGAIQQALLGLRGKDPRAR